MSLAAWARSRGLGWSTVQKARHEGRLTAGAGIETWDREWGATHPDWRPPPATGSQDASGAAIAAKLDLGAGHRRDVAPRPGNGHAEGDHDYAGARIRHMSAKASLVELELEERTQLATGLTWPEVFQTVDVLTLTLINAAVQHVYLKGMLLVSDDAMHQLARGLRTALEVERQAEISSLRDQHGAPIDLVLKARPGPVALPGRRSRRS